MFLKFEEEFFIPNLNFLLNTLKYGTLIVRQYTVKQGPLMIKFVFKLFEIFFYDLHLYDNPIDSQLFLLFTIDSDKKRVK